MVLSQKRMTYGNKVLVKLSLAVLCFIIPMAAYAAGLVPCGGSGPPPEPPCDFGQLLIMINGIINFLLYGLALPLTAIAFAFAGGLFLTARGNEAQVTKAKGIFWSVLWGFILMLSAWLLVKAFTYVLLKPGYTFLS